MVQCKVRDWELVAGWQEASNWVKSKRISDSLLLLDG